MDGTHSSLGVLDALEQVAQDAERAGHDAAAAAAVHALVQDLDTQLAQKLKSTKQERSTIGH